MSAVLHNLGYGFSVALQPANLLYAALGAFVGSLIGVLPGIGPVTGVALLIPLVVGINPASAMIMLTAVFYGAMYGGSTTSILVNVPGEASSVATTFDGYQMALQGRAGPALSIAAIGSFIAGTFGVVGMMFFSLPLAHFALRFGPAEYCALMILGLSTVATLAGENLVKAILSVLFGLMLATVGTDLVTGIDRYTFGVPDLLDGIDLVTVAVGLFAISEVLLVVEQIARGERKFARITRLWLTMKDFTASWWSIVRGTLVGFYIGILPGAGATIASFLSYGLEKRLARDPSTFGRGDIRGVAAPESANNASAVGAMIPMLTLGIPGSSTTAVMMGALMIMNVLPGPQLFTKHPDVVWGLMASMYVSNAILLLLNLPLVGLFVQILKIRERFLYPTIIVICVIGVFAAGRSVVDLTLMLLLGVLGYYMRRHDYPVGPAILGLVLGDRMEQSMRQALIISNGDWLTFVTRPISAVILLLAALSLAAPSVIAVLKRKPRVVLAEDV
ncbi:MAG: tripartite tricarboxylate transporter permease [Armatimonadota bacterium]|nr:tripartite tricarboxylate transporter permease [Armatimonadota bacterium]